MKKRICLLLGVMMITLSACGNAGTGSVPENQGGDQGASTEATQSQTDTKEETKEEASAEQTPERLPVYIVTSDYYYNGYEGKFTEDAEGNSLMGKTVYEGMAQAVMVSQDSKDAYPELFKNVNADATTIMEEAGKSAKSSTEQAISDLEDSITNEYPFFGPYTDRSVASVSRADSKVLSIITTYSNFMGGAHGMYGLGGVSYDVASGKKLSLSDVLNKNEEELNKILKGKILETGSEDDFADLDQSLSHYRFEPKENDPEDFDNYETAYTWYFGYDGIHFYFGPYEIAAYAFGATDVFIGYDEGDVVKPEYAPNASKGYVVGIDLPMYSKEWDDDTSDLHFVYEPDDPNNTDTDYVTCKSLTLKNKDKYATVDEYYDYNYNVPSVKSYKVVTADNKEYIYAMVLTFSDYTDLLVFDITGGDVKFVGQDSFHLAYVSVDDEKSGEMIFTDPEHISLGRVCDMMGTFTYFGDYRVGKDGMPQLISDYYTISWISEEIKSLKEIEVTLLDEKGAEQGKENLPAGTHITPFRTDSKTFVDAKLDDGRIVRFTYTNSEYPYEIGGQKVDDLFEGLMYAG